MAMLALAFMAHAQFDDVQLALLEQFDTPLRWDNVEGGPHWLAGPRPVRHRGEGVHVLRLQPGQSSTLWFPDAGLLRIRGAGSELSSDALALGVSDGSGLIRMLQPPEAAGEWLLKRRVSSWRVVHIQRPAWHDEAIDVAVFVGRYDAFGDIAPYRDVLPLPTKAVRLRREHDAVAQRFWPLVSDEPVAMTVRGPMRLQVEQRYRYGENERETSQAYALRTWLNDQSWQTLHFETGPETRYPVWVAGRVAVVGRREHGYVEIPEGEHRLTLLSTASLYVRVVGQDQPDYLLPGRNAPDPEALEVRQQRNLALPTESGWDIAWHEHTTPSTVQRQAQALAHNNRRRDGPMVGAAMMAQLAASRPDVPEFADAADRLLGGHGFYRQLLPLEKHSLTPQRFARFATPRWRSPQDDRRDVLMARQHVAAAARRLADGVFTQVGVDAAAQVYPLPARGGSTRLRVAVARGASPAQLFIQYDDRPPKRLRVEPDWRAPDSAWLPGSGEMAAALLARQHGGAHHPVLGGPYALQQPPAPLIDAHVVELALPQAVERVRIWREGGDSPLWLALQYRASGQFKLTESQYLNALSPTSSFNPHAFLQRLEAAGDAPPEVAQHWRSLARRLHVQRDQFIATVVPPKPTATRLTPAQQTTLAEQAQAYVRQHQWLLALEMWSVLVHGGAGQWRKHALMGQVAALNRLGEGYLARQQLKALMVHDSDDAVRTAAFEALRDHYRRVENDGALQSLYASALLHRPTVADVAAYAELLLGNGHADDALLLLLALPSAQRSPGLVLQAAYQAGWWRLFNETLTALPDGELRNLWAGYRAQWQGDYKGAVRLWRHAGGQGQALADALLSGWDIQRGLNSDHDATRRDAIAHWSHWQVTHPGPKAWRREAGLVMDHDGAVATYAIERDITSLGYRATRQRPLKVGVVGPARLRFEVRPLHAAGVAQALDGWLKLRDGETSRALPVTANRAVTATQLIGVTDQVPGALVVMDYDVGPGWHDVELLADGFDVLVSPAVQRPQLPLAVLPPMTAETVGEAWAGRFDGAGEHRLVCHGVGDNGLLHRCRYRRPFTPRSVDGAELTRWTQAIGSDVFAGVATPQSIAPGGIDPAQTMAPFTTGMTEAQARDHMMALLWRAEADVTALENVLPEAEALVRAYPEAGDIKSMLARLSRQVQWQLITTVEHSAGLRYRDVSGWQPESSIGRVRKALLGITDPDAFVVSGASTVGLAMSNVRPARLALSLTMAELPHMPPHPVTVSVQMDDDAPQLVKLHSGATVVHLDLVAPAGSHALRIGIVEPVANQYVVVRLTETSPAGAVLARSGQRAYHVATVDEPVALWVDGPAWLRVDEWLPTGEAVSRYRDVAAGWQKLELHASPGQRESLLRIYRRAVVDDAYSIPPPPTPDRELNAIPGPLLQVAQPQRVQWLSAVDQLPLGRQDDGTWSINAALSSRQTDDEGGDGRRFTERFLQLGAAWRYFAETDHSYWKGEVLGRLREEGGPVTGALGWWDYLPPLASWRFTASASAYAQSPGPDGGLEWATTLRGRVSQQRDINPKTFHRPYGEAFKRWLSLDENHGYNVNRLDRDVFTDYKAAHRHGITLGDRLVHAPWLDTQWYGDVSLTTNESLNPLQPDHVRARIGWRQLLRYWQLNAEYDYRRFFDDSDRDGDADRNRLNLSVEWNHWRSWQRRWQVSLAWRHDVEPSTHALLLQLRWHGGIGRGLRDFRPSELAFRQLRRRHIPPAPNNGVSDD